MWRTAKKREEVHDTERGQERREKGSEWRREFERKSVKPKSSLLIPLLSPPSSLSISLLSLPFFHPLYLSYSPCPSLSSFPLLLHFSLLLISTKMSSFFLSLLLV